MDLAAGTRFLICETQEATPLIEQQAKIARPADELEALGVSRGAKAVAAGAARRSGQQVNALVVTDSLDADSRSFGKNADGNEVSIGHGIIDS